MEVTNMTELLDRLNEINEELDITNNKTVLRNIQLEHQINMMKLQEINENLNNLGGNK